MNTELKKIYSSLFSWGILLLLLSFSLTSCEDDEVIQKKENPNSITGYKTPKYVFFLIGDGMAAPQINITEAAIKSGALSGVNGTLNIRQLPVTGLQTTHAENRYITGSAAAGTALATGHKTSIGTIGMNGNHTERFTSIATFAKKMGKKVGIVSSVSIDHATPASFYAHVTSRGQYQEIGQFLINSDFDYFAGGNVRHNKYKNYTLNDFIKDAGDKGYKYVNTRSVFDALDNTSGKVIATLEHLKDFTADGCAMPYSIDIDEFKNINDKITLADFTKKGIELIDNENGFFMMVEAGKIDWACHANDVVSAAQDVLEFDRVIGVALDFYKKHPEETLIVVTGDHECGGLTLGHSSTRYETAFDLLKYQKQSYVFFTQKVREWRKKGGITFEKAMEEVKETFGLGLEKLELNDYEKGLLVKAFARSMKGELKTPEELFDKQYIYGYYDPFTITITHVLNNKAGVDWTTYSHTATPVPVFAIGQGQYEFNGYYDNTDIAKKIMTISKYKEW